MAKKKYLSEDAKLVGTVPLRAGELKIYKSVEDDIITFVHEAYGSVLNQLSINTESAPTVAKILANL